MATTSSARLVMMLVLPGDARHAEVPLQRAQLVDVDLGVLAGAAADVDDLLPRRPELRAHAIDDAAVVLALLVELVAADVDALELLHDVARAALVGVAVAEEPRGQAKHGAVE